MRFAWKDPQDPPLACNLEAIPAAARPRYQELRRKLRAAIRARRPLSSGYVLELGPGFTPAEAGEWISLEKRCCPFLDLELRPSSGGDSCELTLCGPESVKPMLDLEFPAP
jgi:hypothetical protein